MSSSLMSSNEQKEERTLEEVHRILEFAKLKISDIKPFTQCINFSEELDNEKLKLLEVDKKTLETLEAGKSLVIRGEKNNSAIMCTDDKTFELKEAEMSNSLLVIPDCVFGSDISAEGCPKLSGLKVVSSLQTYYEMRPVRPKLEKLKLLLEKNQYSGQECEEDSEHLGPKFTTENLLDIVQASEKELFEGLRVIDALQIEGYWRLLEFDFLTQVLSHILQLTEEEDWLFAGVPVKSCCDVLGELYLRCVVEHVLRIYSEDTENSASDDELLKLSEDKICRFFAKLTIKNTGKFNLAEFMQVWKQCVPEGMTPNLRQLEGMALVNKSSKPEVISYFPVEELPQDIGQRFNILFQTHEKWTLTEITPYLKDLEGEKQNIGSMLLKFARASTQNGQKVFSSRHPIT